MQEVKQKKIIYFSIDDVFELFYELNNHYKYRYVSICHHPILKIMKSLYKKYGVTTILYCYFEKGHFDLTMISDRFKKQFEKNSYWLKVAFHGKNEHRDYNHLPVNEFILDYQQTVKELICICGEKTLSSILRLHLFAGSRKNCRYLKSQIPNLILLGADDTRNSYYLNEKKSLELFTKRRFYDPDTKIHFLKTDLRLEREDFDTLLQTEIIKDSALQVFTHQYCFQENIYKLLDILKCINK